jgi:hypothetical protein
MNEKLKQLEKAEKEYRRKLRKELNDEEHFWENYEEGWPYPDDDNEIKHE